nr:unnamed protein product [Callosobruchus analis]
MIIRSKAILEVQRYYEEPLLNQKENPLSWWKNNNYNFPNLFKVFIKHSATVSTSVPCERLFSKTGEILSQRRSRLSADKVKKILFIKTQAKLMKQKKM